MRAIFRRSCFVAAALSLSIGIVIARAQANSQSSDAQSLTIRCRVLEAKTARTPAVTLVIFHQAESADRDSLGAFLRKADGEGVEFQTADGVWHPASIFRLKSCFGRGLLVMTASEVRLHQGDKFLLR